MINVGIDLGTTNTVVATDMQVRRISEAGGSSPILASVVAFPPSGVTLVGQAARRRRAIDPKNTIFSAKRLMASKWHSRRANDFRDHYPFELVETDEGYAAFKTRAGIISPPQVGAKVISAICQRTALNPEELNAVVTVPAEFDQEQRNATVEAVKTAGVNRVRVIDEPSATALAYSHRSAAQHERIAVYDLGGGTFDLAIISCAGSNFDVLAHGGDAYLGGDDIDRRIAAWAADELLKRCNWDLHSDPEVFDRLIVECERAKIRLSQSDTTNIELAQVDPAAPETALNVEINQRLLSELATDLVRRTFSICDEVLRDANTKASEIDAVFLAGGITQLQMIRQGIASYFGTPPRCDFDPMEVVSIGASLAAAEG